MCGLSGFIQREGFDAEKAAAWAASMADALFHRGPDDGGVWVDAEAGVALSHRRLAILDLSPTGHQPMHSTCGRYVIVFNGEIYNHLDLRKQLNVSDWRGHSDTETLLTSITAWGVEQTLRRCVGMFAFALWDKTDRTLILARDRLGEKPLYYGWQHGVLLFGSELKSLRAHPAFAAEIDRDVLTLLLRHSYIPAPYSIYRGIHKLMPGTYWKYSHSNNEGSVIPYWSMKELALSCQSEPYHGSEDEAVSELGRLIDTSLSGQMMADVPLGAFLSGGVDSSTIVALMQSRSSQAVKTFSIGFNEVGYNEAEYAKAVARHLGTEHTELYVTSADAMAVVPILPTIFDEPFADASQIATLLVAKMAKQHVTVALSGDAGDELFGGYNRYTVAVDMMRMVGWLPHSLRMGVAKIIKSAPAQLWNGVGRVAVSGDVSEKARKLADIIESDSLETLYRQLVSHWKNPEQVVIGSNEPTTMLSSSDGWIELHEFVHRMMYLDTITYLPNDILTKVDRTSMAVSLETRVPFLDHRIIDFAWRLPLSMKIRNGQGKYILRQLLYRYVPKDLIERPKRGFAVPIADWLRGPLREWAEDLLDEGRLYREGYLEPKLVRRKWQEHLSGRHNWQYHLWNVLMFQAWLQEQGH